MAGQDLHELFSDHAMGTLRTAANEFSWLLNRKYSPQAALKLVGDRHSLVSLQRNAIMRVAATKEQVLARRRKQTKSLAQSVVHVDALNVFTTLEVAMTGGLILQCADGCWRDIAGVHGTYRPTDSTLHGLRVLQQFFTEQKTLRVEFFIDKPVSKSGQLRLQILSFAERFSLPWDAHLVTSPDHELATSHDVVVTADSAILDRCMQWSNLVRDFFEAQETQLHGKVLVFESFAEGLSTNWIR